MNALLFDTLRLSRTLRDKGHFTSEQAEALADLAAAIAELKSELKSEIAGIKIELLKWIIGALGFQTIVIVGALISLVRIVGK